MKRFDLNNKEAFKLMLDGKKVISTSGRIFYLDEIRCFVCYESEDYTEIISYEQFLKNYSSSKAKFLEYIEPNNHRKYEFESYIGENFGVMPFEKCPIEVALKHQCSSLNDDYNALKSMYKNVSKVKVTLEISNILHEK